MLILPKINGTLVISLNWSELGTQIVVLFFKHSQVQAQLDWVKLYLKYVQPPPCPHREEK